MIKGRKMPWRAVAISLALAGTMVIAQRADAADGAQFSGDCDLTYINKQVGVEQWAITWEIYGNVSGNVFKTDGSPPSFIECVLVDEDETNEIFDCYGSDACAGPPCGGTQWTLISSNVSIPLTFFFPPGIDPFDPFDQCVISE